MEKQTLTREERARIAARRRTAQLGQYPGGERQPSPRPSRKKRRKKKKHTALAVCLVVVAVLVLCVVGVINFVLGDYHKAETFSAKDLAVSADAPSGLRHIAVFGVDSYDQLEGRADSTMVITMDKKHRQIKLTSIQRDSYLPVKDHVNDKLTHAFAYGGAELMLHTINSNFDMNVTDYVVLDYKDVADMVDIMGGLVLDISESERKELNRICLEMDPSHEQVEESGEQYLDGLQVTAFARIRKIDSETQRTARQRLVLGKLFEKMKQKNVADYPDLLRKLAAVPTCSLSKQELISLATQALTYDTQVRQYVIPSEEDDAIGGSYSGFWCWRYDIDAAKERWHAFLKEDVSVEEN